jgi:hypothetical protein
LHQTLYVTGCTRYTSNWPPIVADGTKRMNRKIRKKKKERVLAGRRETHVASA